MKKLLITTQIVDKNDPILGFFHGWILEFAKHFEHIDVICLKAGGYELPDHVSVYSLGKEDGESRLKYTIRFYRYFWNLYVRNHVDFVFFHMGAIYNIMASPFFLVRKLRGTKFYWWKAHGHINFLGKLATVFVDCVYTSTTSGFKVQTKKRKVIGQAIDSGIFKDEQKTKKYDLIFVGRIMPVKHIEDFVDTVELLRKRNNSIKALIVGPFYDKEYEEKIRALVEKKNLLEAINFIGPLTQKDLVPLYQESKIFLNTSRTDSMDKTLLEAVLCGCIPFTGNKAFKDILGPYDLYSDSTTPESFQTKILKVFEADTDSIVARLQNLVQMEHSLDTLNNRIFNF